MVDDDGPDGESRLARWSRLKQRRGGAAAPVAVAAPAPASADAEPTAPATGMFLDDPLGGPGRRLTAEEEAVVKTLPPLESLTADSDFAPFMASKVPDFLQRAALRKLWSLNPFFNFRDGLNDYDLNYALDPTIVAAVDTKYHAERGMFDENDPEDPRYQARLEAEKRARESAAAEDEDIGDGEDDGVAIADGESSDASPRVDASEPARADAEGEPVSVPRRKPT